MCNRQCDHCFLFSGPQAKGTFTLEQLSEVFKEITRIKSIEWVYFEGGEPFLFYPIMIEGIKRAREIGCKSGIVTNAYWATANEDAQLWLKPLSELGVSDLSISDDSFHSDTGENGSGNYALSAAKELGIAAGVICIEEPSVNIEEKNGKKGEPIIGGGVKFRGRAVNNLTQGLPMKSWRNFSECPYEDLQSPERIHLDSYGNVHLCQGLIMGNMWKMPLSEIVKSYDLNKHPICKYLVEGGPTLLAEEYNVHDGRDYIDACHLCYQSRLKLLSRHPEYLAPEQVYGLEEGK
jgi:MoaA/NifB/PqqE/SkfB family radical SAM enzyme